MESAHPMGRARPRLREWFGFVGSRVSIGTTRTQAAVANVFPVCCSGWRHHALRSLEVTGSRVAALHVHRALTAGASRLDARGKPGPGAIRIRPALHALVPFAAHRVHGVAVGILLASNAQPLRERTVGRLLRAIDVRRTGGSAFAFFVAGPRGAIGRRHALDATPLRLFATVARAIAIDDAFETLSLYGITDSAWAIRTRQALRTGAGGFVAEGVLVVTLGKVGAFDAQAAVAARFSLPRTIRVGGTGERAGVTCHVASLVFRTMVVVRATHAGASVARRVGIRAIGVGLALDAQTGFAVRAIVGAIVGGLAAGTRRCCRVLQRRQVQRSDIARVAREEGHCQRREHHRRPRDATSSDATAHRCLASNRSASARAKPEGWRARYA